MTTPVLALIWGCISAVSLPLGAAIGLWLKPEPRFTSAMMAFGGGALLFALTIELFAHSLHISHQGHDVWIILSTMAGAALGGLLFELLNRILNNQGAFLRKLSLIQKHIRRFKQKNAQEMIHALSKNKLLTLLPPGEFVRVIPSLKREHCAPGNILFKQGDRASSLYFVISGKAEVVRESEGGSRAVAVLGEGDIFGEMALLSDKPRSATVVALTDLVVSKLLKSDFEHLLRHSPRLQEAVRRIAKERLDDLRAQREISAPEAALWKKKALLRLKHLSIPVTENDLARETEKHPSGAAALSIWLGIALDGIPESLVIGMLVVAASAANAPMSLAFIAGVFLANFPEAMSSAATMQRQGTGLVKILCMWMSLCLMTGVGAWIGAVIFPPNPAGSLAYFISGIEGLAAGAMLTMIADTMLPEAFEHGGGAVAGLCTLAGFLSALGG